MRSPDRPAIDRDKTGIVLAVLLATGARRGETLALRWKSVDLDRGTIRIVESLE